MRTLKLQCLLLLCLACFHITVYALNFDKYVTNLKALQADENARLTLLSIFESCGDSRLNDDCVIQELERIWLEENNTVAQHIIENYNKTQTEGNILVIPECQVESHFQVNRILGHCLLLLNYSALKDNDAQTAKVQFEVCLQGGMSGLAYNHNLAAQYILIQIFEEKQIFEHAQFWKKNVQQHKGTEEYALLMQCYR